MKRRGVPAAQLKSNKSKTSGPAPSATTSPSAPRITWPVLSPTSPDLALEVQDTPGLALVPNLLSARDCASIIALFSDTRNPLLQPPRPPAKDEAARSNWRWTGNEKDFADVLWRRFINTTCMVTDGDVEEPSRDDCLLDGLEGPPGMKPVCLNPDIRVYRYEPGQSFGKHYDDSVVVRGQGTEWTLLIYLTGSADGLVGGETIFYPDARVISKKGAAQTDKVAFTPERGTALLHRHGRECALHEGAPVLKGVKWILRSDVVFGRT